MKILLFIDSLERGGAQRQFIELVKGLYFKKEIQFELVLFSDNIHYTEIFNYDIKLHIFKRNGSIDFTLFRNILSVVTTFKPDVIHSWHFVCNYYLLPIIILKKIKFIDGSIRDANTIKPNQLRWYLNKISFKLATKCVSNSRAGLKAYQCKNGLTIYNGIDLDRFSTQNNPTNYDEILKDKNNIIIAMVARFGKSKDYNTYLSAANEITTLYKNVFFFAIGDGPFLKDFMNKFKGNNNIIFTGRISNVENIIIHVDVGVLLSDPRFHAEGISNSIMEYMAAMKPVIASKSGGTPEIIVSKDIGIMVPPLSKENYKDAVMYLIENSRKRKEIGLNAYNHLVHNFSFKNMINEYLKLYQRIY
ncbi:glycosyltransferase [Saccharicrinis sp. FJH2]|uniref:glycosyltransferase n=1 Tax=Saccharicrinis sp. FJH65 TaxID=3344659 RepID=UPI0035F2C632